MSTVMPVNASSELSLVAPSNATQQTNAKVGVFSHGLDIMYMYLMMLTSLGNGLFDDMAVRSESALEAQKMAGLVNAKLIQLSLSNDSKEKTTLSQEVCDYLNQNKISVSGLPGGALSYDDKGNWTPIKVSTDLNRGDLEAIKGSLDNEANRASDYISQSQLQMQKVMQTYSTTVALINSTQSMVAEMNKSIAQNIR